MTPAASLATYSLLGVMSQLDAQAGSGTELTLAQLQGAGLKEPLNQALPYLRTLDLADQAALFERVLGGEQSVTRESVQHAVASVRAGFLEELGRSPTGDGISSLESRIATFRRLGLGTALKGDLTPSSLEHAMSRTLERQGVPVRTRLRQDQRAEALALLRQYGFTESEVPQVPESIDWNIGREMPGGIGHGKPLARRHDGTVVVPIFMAGGSVYPEHIHVGTKERTERGEPAEHVVFLLDGGNIKDRAGRYATSAQYAQAAGSIHTPENVGLNVLPVAFLGIAFGGVILTGLPGKDGANLLEDFEIGSDLVAALLQDIADVRRDRTLAEARSDVMKYVFNELRLRRLSGRQSSWGPEEGQNFVQELIRTPPADRIRRVSTALAEADDWPPLKASEGQV